MFGLSFGELCVLIIVAIVVIGPKDMPKMLRKAGQLAGKIRRMASDVRTQSGIDDVLRADGLHEDIAEIRKLAQADFLAPIARPSTRATPPPEEHDPADARQREYPADGADSYGAVPETALLYANASSPSPLARDALYVTGDPAGVLPAPATEGAAPPAADDEEGAGEPEAASPSASADAADERDAGGLAPVQPRAGGPA